MSVTRRFATLGSVEVVGVEIHSIARAGLRVSAHRNISCGFRVGTDVATSGGFTGFAARSKIRMLHTSALGGQAWMTALHRKYTTASSFCCGHTRSSREVWPAFEPVTNSVPNSPTTVGWAGSATSTTEMPGCRCGQESTPVTSRLGSPTPQREDPSVRLPTYTKWSKTAGAAFMPRSYSELRPTSVKPLAVPGT
jgi:hypothetical protein